MRERRRMRSTLAVCMGAAGLAILTAGPSATATARITSELDTKCTAKLNGDEWRALSLAAGRVLMHADQARTEIAEKKIDPAKADVEKGLTLIRIIEKAAPEYEVSAEIQSGDLVYKDRDETSAGLIPIYDQLDKVDLVGPVARAVRESSKQASSGDTAPVVMASALEFTSLDLDVPVAKSGLELADEALKERDAAGADAGLQMVQGAVVLRYDAADVPLVRAADNLEVAESELRQGDHDAARAALSAASDALKQYEKVAGDSRSPEVKKLRTEIDAVARDLLSKNLDEVRQRVSHWWDRVVAWFQK
jgi:hypothetical protein